LTHYAASRKFFLHDNYDFSNYLAYMQTLTQEVFLLGPPGGLFDQAVVRNLFPDLSQGARNVLITRAVASGEVLKPKRGFYVLSELYRKSPPHLFAVAPMLYGPSAISLESALAFHGLIPMIFSRFS
jgi:predicted transcriptional regulator of viral defense system